MFGYIKQEIIIQKFRSSFQYPSHCEYYKWWCSCWQWFKYSKIYDWPDSAKNFIDAIEKCYLVIQNLKKLLKSNKMLTNVGDEGGFAPSIDTNEQALELIVSSISQFKPGKVYLFVWM